jgi:hypothetical protein
MLSTQAKRFEDLCLSDVLVEIHGQPASNAFDSCTDGKRVTLKMLSYGGTDRKEVTVNVVADDGTHDAGTFSSRDFVGVEDHGGAEAAH